MPAEKDSSRRAAPPFGPAHGSERATRVEGGADADAAAARPFDSAHGPGVEGLLAAARSREARLVELACDLIRAVSVNPPGDEHRPAAVVEKFLKGLGVPARRIEAAPGRTNLIASVGRPGGKRLLVPVHLDTVPASEGWGPAAFEPKVEGGLITGRGAVDDKGPLAAALIALELLHQEPPAGEFVLIAAADEERGSRLGLEHLAASGELRGDFALVPDIGGNLAALDVAEKGVTFIEARASGRAAHGSRPSDGANAVLAMAEFLAEIEAWRPDHNHPLLGRPTTNVGSIAGGEAPNMVPDRCLARIDCRYLPGMTAAWVRDQFAGLAARVAGRREGVAFDLKILSDLPPSQIDPQSPLVRCVRELAPQVTGRPVELIGLGGATLCKQCLAAGIPAVGFGPGSATAAHAAGESVEVRELVEFAAFLALLARRLLE